MLEYIYSDMDSGVTHYWNITTANKRLKHLDKCKSQCFFFYIYCRLRKGSRTRLLKIIFRNQV